jgi:hypothetical protein
MTSGHSYLTTRNMTFYDIFICDNVKFVTNNYIYDKFYEAFLMYDKIRCSSLKCSQKYHRLVAYKTMTFFVTIRRNVIIVAAFDLLTRLPR